MATVKVDDETYEELNRIAGELRAATGRPVAIDEVIRDLLKRRRPSDFVGSWRMTDEEEAEIFGALRKLWSKWNPG
jgi:predicted CopG family antitoxin